MYVRSERRVMGGVSHAHFLDAVEALGAARRKIERYLLEAEDDAAAGFVPVRLGERWKVLYQARLMTEATFRLMKYAQFGDYANHRDAVELWTTSIHALDRDPAQADPIGALDLPS